MTCELCYQPEATNVAPAWWDPIYWCQACCNQAQEDGTTCALTGNPDHEVHEGNCVTCYIERREKP